MDLDGFDGFDGFESAGLVPVVVAPLRTTPIRAPAPNSLPPALVVCSPPPRDRGSAHWVPWPQARSSASQRGIRPLGVVRRAWEGRRRASQIHSNPLKSTGTWCLFS